MKKIRQISMFIGFGLFMLFSLSSCSLIDKYITNHEHIWNEYYTIDGEKHWKECQFPFCKETKEVGYHEGEETPCDVKNYCVICNNTYGNNKGHNYEFCDGSKEYFSNQVNDEGVPLFYYTCSCGEVSKEPKEYYEHFVFFVDKTEPTCTKDGLESHYECYHCEERYFLDEDGHYSLTYGDISIEKLGHNYTGELSFTDEGHFYKCERCVEYETVYAHEYVFYDFNLNREFTYGEVVTSKDVNVYQMCYCGYTLNQDSKAGLYVADYIIQYGTNYINISFNGVPYTIEYNAKSNTNSHDDWEKGYNGQEFTFEGIVTATSYNEYDNSFYILDDEGYGYYVYYPMATNETPSIGDRVIVTGYKQVSAYIEEYLYGGSYKIIDDVSIDQLPEQYFVNASSDYVNMSPEQFNNRYIYVPIILDDVVLQYREWNGVSVMKNDKNFYLIYEHNYLPSEQITKNNCSAFGGYSCNVKGLYSLYNNSYCMMAMKDIETFSYNSQISSSDKQKLDSEYMSIMMNWLYQACEGKTYDLVKPLHATEYSYSIKSIHGTIVDNKITFADVNYSQSFYLTIVVYYPDGQISWDFYGTIYEEKEYDLSLVNLYDLIVDWETSHEVIYKDNLNKLNCYKYDIKVTSSHDQNQNYIKPTVTVNENYLNIVPINNYTVTNYVEITLFYDDGTAVSRQAKIVTMDNRYYRNSYLMDASQLTDYGISYVGSNGSVKIDMSNCFVQDGCININAGSSLEIYCQNGLSNLNVDLYSKEGITQNSMISDDRYECEISSYTYGNDYLYDYPYFPEGNIKSCVYENLTSNIIQIKYLYIEFYDYK